MIVITLTKVPNSLRGDLTKWCQEIQTGVYVGSFSARIRERLWARILKNIGTGEATLVYSTNNELGYTFKTTRNDKKVIDYDGIPLMMQLASVPQVKHGFSNEAKYHRAKKYSKIARFSKKKNKNEKVVKNADFIAIDIETTGLNLNRSKIISIGAVKESPEGSKQTFYKLIKINEEVPTKITQLTGLTSKILYEKGVNLEEALISFRKFIGDQMLVGYNLSFDYSFLLKAYSSIGQEAPTNSMKDLMPIVKQKNMFLDNYQMSTVLKEYGINNTKEHNALGDANATFELAKKLNENGDISI